LQKSHDVVFAACDLEAPFKSKTNACPSNTADAKRNYLFLSPYVLADQILVKSRFLLETISKVDEKTKTKTTINDMNDL